MANIKGGDVVVAEALLGSVREMSREIHNYRWKLLVMMEHLDDHDLLSGLRDCFLDSDKSGHTDEQIAEWKSIFDEYDEHRGKEE